ncbi:hypothetical protein AQJ23_44790 [Streptomyces antibioticus]|nr:peptidoglycan DD-metalloendopeptidase family protein [Streptomyces antibioticus]KUN16514.1 hypothetical protein AQJ23_44790 [Streptomyces antibioticus]
MAGPDLDIVGTAAVDVVPIAPTFHTKLQAIVLPAADRVGEEAGRRMGQAISNNIVIAIPNAINRGGQAGQQAARRQGDQVGGAFARSIKNRLEIAFRSLPKADVRLSDTGFNADLARLRARMETLSRKTVGVDVDAGAALAEIQAIDAELKRLGAKHPDINVRADTAAARAELKLIKEMADAVDRKRVNIRVFANTAQAQSAIFQLTVSLGILAALPVVPIAAAGIGAIASATTVAAAGVGALVLAAIPAIKGVTSVIQLKTAAEKQAASATDNSAAANQRAAQSALQMASAQQSLASAHRNAARSIAQANRQVEDAERALGQAAARAMEQRQEAARRVEDAERSLTDAKRDAWRAEVDLAEARAEAARELADLNDQLERGKLDEREATLRLKEAEQELAEVRASYDAGNATELEMERAQLAYDQAAANAKQSSKDYEQLQKDADAAKKAGVDGNKDVQDAANRLADAQEKVRDQVQAVADAQREAAKAQVDAAQSVAAAQRNLADAVDNAANTQVQAAESIASAERGVESARLSSIDTTAQATTKTDEYREALAKLTPEQRDLYDSIAGPDGLTAAFKEWSRELQPEVLPLFTRGVDGAKNSLPGLTPLVENSADAIGELMDRASEELDSPFWDRFKKGIVENAEPAIIGLGVSFGNVFKGMAGVVDAFFPHMDSISERMQRITGRFANWGTNLRGSPEFEKFLDYVSEHGPIVGEAFGDIAEAVIDLAKALEPFSTVTLELLGYVSDAISWVAENAPWSIQLIYGLWIATKLWSLAMASSPIGLVVLGLVGLALAVRYAWDHFEWFRDIVTASWEGIQEAAEFAWTKVLAPTFGGIWDAIKFVGDGAVWLWQEIFAPAFAGISLIVRTAVAIVVTALLTPLWLAIQGVGLLVGWLYTDCFKPTYDGIAWAAEQLWKYALEPFFGLVWDGTKWVGDKFVWLYDSAFKPSADWIAEKAAWLWENGLDPAFGWIWDGLKWVGDKFVWLYDHAVKPSFGWISDRSEWLWEKGLSPAFELMKDGVGLVGDAFESARDAISDAWGELKDITKTPVNFIIKWVYTKGIKAVWDKVASFVGLDPLPDAPKLLEAGGTVGNGWGPAVPMRVNRPTAIVGEGNPNYPEYVIPTDPKYRSRALALHQAAGTQLLESGGILGGFSSAWDWTKDTVGDVVGKGIDWAKTGADLIAHPSKIWNKLTAPILSKIPDGIGTSPMAKSLTKLPGKMVGGLKDMIVNAVSGMFAGGGGVGQWIKPVNVPYGTKFGVAGSMWSSGHHTGLDFPAPVGTPVHAVAGGTVVGVGHGGPYGNNIEISHGGGLTSLYAHMSKTLAGLNKYVAQGETIGKVGATGNVTGPHLHLEARLNGKAVDPMPYLTSLGAGSKVSQSIAAAKNFAKGQLRYFGWGPSQFAPLERLWEGESGWRWNAENPSSGAYGIPQALPPTKMASAGPDWRTNAATQILWGLDYIRDRPDYGSPSAAYSKWLSRSPHWYDDGGYLPPGLSLVANGTGKPEPIFTSGQWDDIRASKGGGGTTEIHADVRVFVGDREITDIVRTEVDARESLTASAIDDGRWI